MSTIERSPLSNNIQEPIKRGRGRNIHSFQDLNRTIPGEGPINSLDRLLTLYLLVTRHLSPLHMRQYPYFNRGSNVSPSLV